MKSVLRSIATIAAAALTVFSQPAVAQTTTVKFASVGGLTDAGIYIADARGYFAEAEIAVEIQRIPNAPALIAAVTTSQVDVAGISVTPGLFTASEQGFKLKIVGDKQSYRQNGFVATQFAVKPEFVKATEKETFEGMKGKTIAISARASIATMVLFGMMAKNGLKPEDVNTVDMSYPNMVAALESGAVQGAVLLEPFLSRGIEAGTIKVVGNPLDGTRGKNPVVVPLVYSETFAANRPLATKFMVAYMKGVRAYNDAFRKDVAKDEIVDIIAKGAKVDAAVVRNSYPAGLGPNQEVDVEALESFQQFFVDGGQVKTPIDVKSLLDPSFAEAAVAELGPYDENAK